MNTLAEEIKVTGLKNGLNLFEFDAGDDHRQLQRPSDAIRVVRHEGKFMLPYKSKKGFYPHPVQINAMLINCCHLGAFEKYYKPGTCEVQRIEEKREYRHFEGDIWLRVYGWTEAGNFLCRFGGGVAILPFHCVAIDWTGYEQMRIEFLAFWGK